MIFFKWPSKALKTSPIFQPALLTKMSFPTPPVWWNVPIRFREGARPGHAWPLGYPFIQMKYQGSEPDWTPINFISICLCRYEIHMIINNIHVWPAIYIQSLQRTPDYRTWTHEIIQISEWCLRPKFESGHHMCITTAFDNPYIQLGGMIPRLFLNKTTPLHDMFFLGDMWRNATQVKGPSWSQQWRIPFHEASDAITIWSRSHILTWTWPFLLKKMSDMFWKRHPASYSQIMMV